MMAILGGTFDPVHCGHIHAARLGRTALGVATVTLMLAARPWHRPQPAADAAQRWQMLQLAAAEHAWLRPSRLELERTGPSYTADTLAALAVYAPLVWCIGADAVAALGSWHRAEDLPALCHLLVFNRPGAPAPPPPAGFEVAEAAALAQRASGVVHYLDARMLAVSSTTLRREIGAGGAPRGLLPAAVWAHIRRHGLYGASPESKLAHA